MDQNETRKVPVDRGYAWVILAGVFLSQFITAGLIYRSFGVIFLAFVEYYDADPAATAWIGSLQIAVALMGSPVASNLAVRFQVRTLVAIGGIFEFLAFFLCIFVTRMEFLYFTIGIMAGIGDALCFSLPLVILQQYFKKNLSLAIGLGYTGTSVGAMIGSPLFTLLMEEYGLKGALLIWSSLCLHVLVCACLLRPTYFYTRGRVSCLRAHDETLYNQVKVKEVSQGDTQAQIKDESHAPVKRRRNLDLFRSASFLVYSASLFLVMAGYWVCVVLLVPANGATVGLTPREYAFLVSLMGAGDILGRPLMGYLADRKCVNKRALFLFNCCVTSLVTVVMPHVGGSYAPLAVLSVTIGVFAGMCITVPPSILRDITTGDMYTTAVGWMAFFMGTPALFSQPLASYLADRRGSWDYSCYMTSSFLVAGSLLMYISGFLWKPKHTDRTITETTVPDT